ncbi:MAG TPA: glycosyltransferase family 39 protein [Vicinamibacteria bacterium]|nr:glycosyltransferase family 39 protein [Vicinamibacteria bacterium]
MSPLVGPLPALAAALVLFLVPGALVFALLPREDRDGLDHDEALFALLGIGVATSAWVALVLAEAGVFSLLRAAGVVGVAAALVALVCRRRLQRPWPAGRGRRWWSLFPAATVLLLALALQTRPSEYLLGGRDPGTYVAAMALIARTGGIAYVDPAVLSIPPEDVALFYRNPGNADYSWGRFMGMPLERPETGRVVPEFFHLFPAFGAYLFQAMGVKGALATPCVFGVLGTLAVFFAWRRVFGAPVATLAAGLLCLNVVQVWFARYPMSEPMAEFLVFLGLWAFALWEERGSAALGALAGACLGLTLLVRIDSVLIVVPLALYVFVRRAQGALPWSRARALLLPLLLLGGHALVHAAFWSRKYLLEIVNRPYWAQPWWVWIAATAGVMAGLLAAHRLEARAARWMEGHGPLLRRVVVAGVAALALYAYFVRPHLSAWAGGDGNPAPPLAERGWLVFLGFQRLAAHDAQALVRLGWFVTPLVLALALAGLVITLRRWRPPYLFPLLLAGTYAAFFLYKIRVYNDYFFALRRFMPVVVPSLLALAAVALVALWIRRGAARVLSAALAAAIALLFLRDTLPLATYRDWKNSVRFVGDVARRFGPDDVVIFEQPRSVHLLSLPLWAVHGVNALELARFNPDPVRLDHLARAWRGRYRNIYFVHTYSTDLCGLFLQRVEDMSFGTHEWERAYGRKPRRPDPRALHFRISRVVDPTELQVPPLREIDIGGSDDLQVSGFHGKEGGGDHTYRWTGGCASVYLPGARPGDRVTISAATGRRPAPVPVPVRVSMGGRALGSFGASADWADHELRLPDPLPPGPPVLRLDVPAFRPANVLAETTDTRDLGVMVDRIRLQEAGSGQGATIRVSRSPGGPP